MKARLKLALHAAIAVLTTRKAEKIEAALIASALMAAAKALGISV